VILAVWESQSSSLKGRSMPGLVLAIWRCCTIWFFFWPRRKTLCTNVVKELGFCFWDGETTEKSSPETWYAHDVNMVLNFSGRDMKDCMCCPFRAPLIHMIGKM
jgi:hypothetical protein